MKFRHWVGLTFAAVLVGLVATLTWFNAQPLDDEALQTRIDAITFHWENYEEDIKAVSAREAARWQGVLESARCDGNETSFVFALSSPWLERNVALPILVRDPGGHVHVATKGRQAGDSYAYILKLDTPTCPPWFMVQYPRGEVRVVFDGKGTWAAQ